VSTRAIACPHCGYPVRGEKRRGLFQTIAQLPCFVVGLIMILFVVLVILVILDVYYLPGLIPRLLGFKVQPSAL